MTVYMLHFDRPISPDHTAQHYIGSTDHLNQRLREHREGKGARLTQVANERGIGYQVVRIWRGGRGYERYLKSKKCGPRMCPVCTPDTELSLKD